MPNVLEVKQFFCSANCTPSFTCNCTVQVQEQTHFSEWSWKLVLIAWGVDKTATFTGFSVKEMRVDKSEIFGN